MKFSEKEQKNILYGGAALIAAAIVYKAVLPDGTSANEDPTGNGNVQNIGSGPSSVTFDAKKVANKLLEAMRYTGTDEATILAVLKSVNQTQFGQVMYQFGKHSYNPVTGNQYTIPFVSLTLYPLDFWLKSELDDKEYNILRLKYPNYL